MRLLLHCCACVEFIPAFFDTLLRAVGVAARIVNALWIPLGMILAVIGIPVFAFTGGRSLFYGLFDVELSPKKLPIRHFLVTVAAFAVSSSAWCILRLVLVAGPRLVRTTSKASELVSWWVSLNDAFSPLKQLAAIGPPLLIAAWFAGFAVWVSWKQGRSLARILAGVVLGLAVDAGFGWMVLYSATWLNEVKGAPPAWLQLLHNLLAWTGKGYGVFWTDHIFAMVASLLALLFYALLGVLGALQLGTTRTIPSAIGPLMAVLVLGWWGAGAQFFLATWHIPLLLVVAALAIINGFIPFSDHTYPLMERQQPAAATPVEVLTAGERQAAILVASAGGGIQASAWTAKVLEELHRQHGEAFDRALTLISSISGGSLGSAVYVNWIARGAEKSGLPAPFDAASASSLDEVSWGLAWPDLLRVFLPLPTSVLLDRALAMERAWRGNASKSQDTNGAELTAALSSWNARVASGDLPAVIMNSTMVETGGPLLMGTSLVAHQRSGASSTWMDGVHLHVDANGVSRDIPAVCAARLSATFPFVSPAARPAGAKKEPHMVDGGFYDNYGMATLTEWLDQALEAQELHAETHPEAPLVTRVLVAEINGFPPPGDEALSPSKTHGGWVKQIIAPILTLANVRTAGQISHREIELSLLRDKWAERGIRIEVANFELNEPDAPLSWHLMPSQIAKVEQGWSQPCTKVEEARRKVADFLSGC